MCLSIFPGYHVFRLKCHTPGEVAAQHDFSVFDIRGRHTTIAIRSIATGGEHECFNMLVLVLLVQQRDCCRPRSIRSKAEAGGSGAIGQAMEGRVVASQPDGNTVLIAGYTDNNGTGRRGYSREAERMDAKAGRKLIGADAVGKCATRLSIALSPMATQHNRRSCR